MMLLKNNRMPNFPCSFVLQGPFPASAPVDFLTAEQSPMNSLIIVTILLCAVQCEPAKIRIWDGDTFRIGSRGGEAVWIFNIDAPENAALRPIWRRSRRSGSQRCLKAARSKSCVRILTDMAARCRSFV
ncbi:hypothetical protein [Roseibium sp. TrichSKD4]|uniref:hypothetical protein n=1 Tax=Roseibium sp. TrichSKD4 TaxID=744980 RepID=UPI001FFCA2AE|nr:hypothetical protein [Roseibium sp. TrichSKD4]